MALDYKSSLSRYRRYLQMVQSRPLLATSLWVILSLLLLIILLVLALRPTLITITDLMARINQQKEVSERLEAKMLAVQQASTNLEAVRNQLTLVDQGLPQEAGWDSLAKNLSAMATASGLATEVIIINKVPMSPTEQVGDKQNNVITSTPQGIIPIRFTIMATGTYEQIREFTEQVEKMRRVSIINQMQTDTTKQGNLRVTIQAETGYLQEKFVL